MLLNANAINAKTTNTRLKMGNNKRYKHFILFWEKDNHDYYLIYLNEKLSIKIK